MSKSVISTALLCFVFTICYRPAYAQSVPDTSATQDKITENFKANFTRNIGDQAQLYNGKEYTYYDPSIKGTAYFMDNKEWSPGSVHFDGYTYNNVKLIYDMYRDCVGLQLSNTVLGVVLLSERVKSFTLLNHTFIYVKYDSLSRKPVKTGFYDALYEGKIKLLARREKSIQTASTPTTTESYFLPSVNYYLFANGNYYPVSSKSSILDILKDHKKELQQYIAANNLKFNKTDREQAMVKIAEYYDHLTQ